MIQPTQGPIADLGAEKALLGSVLLDRYALDRVSGEIRDDEFYAEMHAEVFRAARDLHEAGKPVDALIMFDELKRRGKASMVPDLAAFLGELVETVPHAAHAGYYARLVRERAMIRRMVDAANKVVETGRGTHGEQDVRDALGKCEQEIHAALESLGGGDTVNVSISEALLDAMGLVGTANKQGVKTGFRSIDKVTHGFQPGHLVILAARPSCGKTAFAGNIARQAAAAGHYVHFFTLEQPVSELMLRLLACESRIDSNAIKDGNLTDVERDLLMQAASVMQELPIGFSDAAGWTMSQISAAARLSKRKHGTKLIVIDYLQIVEPSDRRLGREQQVSQMSRQLKILARQLSVPVLCLAQLNRSAGQRTDKKPVLSDLRESGSIEQDADQVMFLHRDYLYDTTRPPTEAQLIIGKNRHGAIGRYWLEFHPHMLEFVDAGEPVPAANNREDGDAY